MLNNMNNITDEEVEELNKILMRAYIELCRAEKFLKGSDNNGKLSELNTEQPENSARTPRDDKKRRNKVRRSKKS